MNPRVLDQKLLHTFQSIVETLLTFWFGTKGYVSIELMTTEKPPKTKKKQGTYAKLNESQLKMALSIRKKAKIESMNLPLTKKENVTTNS